MKIIFGISIGIIAAVILHRVILFVIILLRIRRVRKSYRYAIFHADSITAKFASERLANLDAINVKTIIREISWPKKR